MSLAVNFPTELSSFSHLYKAYGEFKTSDELVSYACLLNFATEAIKNKPKSNDGVGFLASTLDLLEKWEKKLKNSSNNEIISCETILSSHVSNVATKVFSLAEKNDANGVYDKKTLKAYYLSSILYSVAQHFSDGYIDDTDKFNRRFSIQRSLHLKNSFKNNSTPKDLKTFAQVFQQSATGSTRKANETSFEFEPQETAPKNENSSKNLHCDIEAPVENLSDKLLDNYSLKFLNQDVRDFSLTDSSVQNDAISYNNKQAIIKNDFVFNQNEKDALSQEKSSQYNQTNQRSKPQNMRERPTTAKKINSTYSSHCTDDLEAGIDHSTMEETKKLLKHVNSALSFNDADTSVTLLYQIIELLKPHCIGK